MEDLVIKKEDIADPNASPDPNATPEPNASPEQKLQVVDPFQFSSPSSHDSDESSVSSFDIAEFRDGLSTVFDNSRARVFRAA